MADAVFPGDLSAGEVIALPGEGGELVVRAVRLGHGSFLLTCPLWNHLRPPPNGSLQLRPPCEYSGGPLMVSTETDPLVTQ